jgi:hypothetical protein
MPGSARTRPQPAGASSGGQAADLYDRYGSRLYRQAYLTTGDQGQAEEVVFDVLVGECLQSPGSPGREAETGRRLAVAAYWRCRELAAPRAWQFRPAEGSPARAATGCAGQHLLSGRERGALALLLFGGLRSLQASQELGIPPAKMSALLLTVLRHLCGLPATSPESLVG